MSKEPKRRRLRGELHSLRRLLPYMRPYLAGIVGLCLVTLAYAGADAGRGALVMPLLNHILSKGAGTGTAEDLKLWSEKIEKHETVAKAWEAEAYAQVDKIPDSVLDKEDLSLGPSLVTFQHKEAAGDPLAKLLVRSRDQIFVAAAQLTENDTGLLKKILDPIRWLWGGTSSADEPAPAPPQRDPDAPRTPLEKRRDKLKKAIAYQRLATERVRDGLSQKDEATRAAAAYLGLEARKLATETMFQGLFSELLWIFAAAIVLAFITASTHFGMFYISRALVTRMVVDIQNKLAEHLLTLSIRYFNEERRGELFSRLTNDLSNTHSVLMLFLSDVLIQPFRLVVLAGAACWVSWQLALSLLVLAFTVIIPVKVWGKRIRRSARDRQASLANVLESMQQMFSGIRIVKAFRREAYENERFHTRTRDYLGTSLRGVWDRTASKSWMELVNDLTVPIMILGGGYLVLEHKFGLDVGRFGAFLVFVVLMYMPAKVLAASYNTLQDALPSVDRILEVLDQKPEIVDAPDATALPKLTDAIKFEDVTFGYVPEKDVLRNVTFTAKVGEVTAIVGPTTAGKSTLVDLIARFYDPRQGRVTADGFDLKKVKLASLLDKIAVVSQEPFLFNDTVRENIRYGRLDATDAEIEAAAKAAKIHDDIAAKPQGYGFVVGERGCMLSGGQRQRITIARAVLKNPEILILDEATSSLDATTERQVQEALEELEHGRTSFVIAHRLSTVRHAHKILVMDNGQIVEEGRHDDLVARGGLYASLVRNLTMTRETLDGNGHEREPATAAAAPGAAS